MLTNFLMRKTSSLRAKANVSTALAVVAFAALSQAASAADLPVWDDYTYEGQSAVMQTLNKNFEAAHPGVTIKRTQRTFDDMALTLKLAVSAGDGPMVTKVNQGAGDMGLMVKEHLLEPVDPYIAKYGWDKRQSDSILARDRWSDKGDFGTGKTYGISGLGEMVGLFYNEKLLKDAGVSLPLKNFDDFLAALDKLKAKGITPITMGTSKQHLALHLIAAIAQAHIDAKDRKSLDDLIYGRGGSWKTPGNLETAKLVQHWAKDGYFTPGYQGISGDDAVQLFIAGQSAFLVSGTWYFGDVKTNPDIHFMAIPAPKGVKDPLTVGGVDLAWAITSLAKDQASKDLAGQYIDYMVSPEAAVEWAKAGYLPSTALPANADIKLPQLLSEGIAMWKTLNAENAIGHYPDWASPTMLKTFDDNTPKLMANDETPEAFVAALDKDYSAYLASKK
ncbi:extracellular solute-binding protein [Allorhizobium sp. BGMRC 0089]|uniref:extracellular solute-binding protein n=1 Tax=Allorhizobium sonneratiae TaxID=2934936 RepID=UPI0020346677|nr:extracellular solute-binding protein [Allorhizobium sonneratiae]MCM2293102.1 extracellular solute-binding protein [Allorhizobium sonneratiae]